MTTATKMTPEQATSFSHVSPINASIVSHALSCGCIPYHDVFTYNRWKAQGYQVKRGEHSIKLGVIKTREVETDTGEVELRKIFGNAHVFCRHQVDKNGNGHTPVTPEPTPQPEPVKPIESKQPIDNLMNGWRVI